MRFSRVFLAAGLAAIAIVPASAQTTTFTDKSAFLAATTGVETNTLDSISTGALPQTLSFSTATFSFSVTSSGTNLWGINKAGDRWLGTENATSSLTINITGGAPTALGGNFFATDISDTPSSATILVTLNDGSFVTYTTSSATAFAGFTTSAPITSLTFAPPTSTVFAWANINNIVLGNKAPVAAPEPTTLVLLALGGVGALARRKRH